jgi:hypothetical protein
MTGLRQSVDESRIAAAGIVRVIDKPYNKQVLGHAARCALDGARATPEDRAADE